MRPETPEQAMARLNLARRERDDSPGFAGQSDWGGEWGGERNASSATLEALRARFSVVLKREGHGSCAWEIVSSPRGPELVNSLGDTMAGEDTALAQLLQNYGFSAETAARLAAEVPA